MRENGKFDKRRAFFLELAGYDFIFIFLFKNIKNTFIIDK